MNSDFARLLNESGQAALATGTDLDGREKSLVTPSHLVELVALVQSGAISGKSAKEVFDDVFKTGRSPKQIVEEKGLSQVSDEGEIARVVEEAMAQNPDAVEKYRGGKTGVIGFLVGKAIQASGGRANPQMVQQEMKRRLDG
jgi:aspartyl-tRNA(Asn)/glutamyl-tRNA(Gln) amidotransferase subunit B